jgi:integrase
MRAGAARVIPFRALGGYGGLRLGEMLALRWSRVDLARQRVHVAETLVDINGHQTFDPPKTTAAIRSVPIPRSVCSELQSMASSRRSNAASSRSAPESSATRHNVLAKELAVP